MPRSTPVVTASRLILWPPRSRNPRLFATASAWTSPHDGLRRDRRGADPGTGGDAQRRTRLRAPQRASKADQQQGPVAQTGKIVRDRCQQRAQHGQSGGAHLQWIGGVAADASHRLRHLGRIGGGGKLGGAQLERVAGLAVIALGGEGGGDVVTGGGPSSDPVRVASGADCRAAGRPGVVGCRAGAVGAAPGCRCSPAWPRPLWCRTSSARRSAGRCHPHGMAPARARARRWRAGPRRPGRRSWYAPLARTA